MHTVTGSFANIIKARNLVDHAIKNGKIDLRESSSKPKRINFPKKKEGETQALYQQSQPNQSKGYASYQNHSNYQPYYSASSNQASTMAPHFTSPNNQTMAIQARQPAPNSQPSSSRNNYPMNNQANNNPRPARPPRPLVELIPMTYTELIPRLIQGQLLARVPLTSMEPPYPRWYDANVTCDYHYGIKGHSTENCLAFKNQIQALRNAVYINFGYNKDGVSNIINNPLPNHSGPKINGILESSMDEKKTYVQNVITPMSVIFEK